MCSIAALGICRLDSGLPKGMSYMYISGLNIMPGCMKGMPIGGMNPPPVGYMNGSIAAAAAAILKSGKLGMPSDPLVGIIGKDEMGSCGGNEESRLLLLLLLLGLSTFFDFSFFTCTSGVLHRDGTGGSRFAAAAGLTVSSFTLLLPTSGSDIIGSWLLPSFIFFPASFLCM
jgi:hypothetical protein